MQLSCWKLPFMGPELCYQDPAYKSSLPPLHFCVVTQRSSPRKTPTQSPSFPSKVLNFFLFFFVNLFVVENVAYDSLYWRFSAH